MTLKKRANPNQNEKKPVIYKLKVTTSLAYRQVSNMVAGRKSAFLFLMSLAWRCRYTMPLLSGTLAALGHAWMFQIRVHTLPGLSEQELAYYDDDEEELDEEEGSWELESTDSWETIVEEVAYG